MTEDLLRELRALRASFLERLPARLGDVAARWRQLLDGTPSPAAVRELLTQVHGLAGTAGSLGMAGLSQAARRMEAVLGELAESGSPPGAADRERMASALAAAEAGRAEAASESLPVARPESAAPASSEAGPGPVFVVDDDTEPAQELRLQLAHYGYDVRALASAEALERALDAEQPSAVLLDAGVAEGGPAGPDLVRRLRLNAGLAAPVLFVSARSDLQARLAAVRSGCAGYFTKPTSVAAVLETLDRLVRRGVEPYRVLVVDDEPEAAAFHATSLRNAGFVVETVTAPLEVMPQLVELRPDLILMDVYMPECSGPELAAVIRQEESFIGIPIVFLSSERDRMRQIAAMGQGGDDFFTKPVPIEQLIAAIAARAQRGRTLRSQMERDGLTRLLTHSRVVEQLEMTVRRAARQEATFAVAMLDVDGFKRVNDDHGHLAGDQVLKSLAFLLRQRLRMTDLIGRFGGDEFTVIMPDTGGRAAVETMDEVRRHFAAITHQRGEDEFVATLSCGVAEFPAARSAHALIMAADEALYVAKRRGRNRVVLAGEVGT